VQRPIAGRSIRGGGSDQSDDGTEPDAVGCGVRVDGAAQRDPGALPGVVVVPVQHPAEQVECEVVGTVLSGSMPITPSSPATVTLMNPVAVTVPRR
jgi:hypothetical protein